MTSLDSYRAAYQRYYNLLHKSLEQVHDEDFFRTLAPETNSIAILVKHLGGNFRSRFTDFLHSDGEKPWRNRDSEFVVEGMSRADVMAVWQEGWDMLWQTLSMLEPTHLSQHITIREESITVEAALLRSLSHFSYHVGEIVFLARHFRHNDWQYLSIAPNQSEAFNAKMRAKNI